MFILWQKKICKTGRLSLVLTIFDFDYWPRKNCKNTGNDWMNQNKVFAWIWPEMELHEIEKIVPGGNYESCAPKLWFREENSLFSHLRWSEALVWWLPAPSWWSIIFDRCRHHRQPADVHSVHNAQCEHILMLNNTVWTYPNVALAVWTVFGFCTVGCSHFLWIGTLCAQFLIECTSSVNSVQCTVS